MAPMREIDLCGYDRYNSVSFIFQKEKEKKDKINLNVFIIYEIKS